MKIAPLRSVRLAAVIVPLMASTKPRQMARAKAGAGALVVAAMNAIELVENLLIIGGRNTFTLVGDRIRTLPFSRGARRA